MVITFIDASLNRITLSHKHFTCALSGSKDILRYVCTCLLCHSPLSFPYRKRPAIEKVCTKLRDSALGHCAHCPLSLYACQLPIFNTHTLTLWQWGARKVHAQTLNQYITCTTCSLNGQYRLCVLRRGRERSVHGTNLASLALSLTVQKGATLVYHFCSHFLSNNQLQSFLFVNKKYRLVYFLVMQLLILLKIIKSKINKLLTFVLETRHGKIK